MDGALRDELRSAADRVRLVAVAESSTYTHAAEIGGGASRRASRSRVGLPAWPCHGDSRFARLGRRSAADDRGADLDVSRRADGNGSKPAFSAARNAGDTRVRPTIRLAGLDLQSAKRRGDGGRT